jgi:hypothetical protein
VPHLPRYFTKPTDEIEALRSRVLAAYPDAAADPVPDIFAGPLALSGAKQEVVNLSRVGPRAPDTPRFVDTTCQRKDNDVG